MFARKLKVFVLAATVAAVVVGAGANSAFAADQYLVDYQLAKWKTVHFDDVKSADTHLVTVKKLGCETKTGSHGGHFDVSFVCPKWRRVAFKTHDEAHQWEKWLKANGFATKHSH